MTDEEQDYIDSVPDLAEDPEAMNALLSKGRSIKMQQLFKHCGDFDAMFKPTRDQSLVRADFHAAQQSGRFRSDDNKQLTLTEALTALWKDANAFDDQLGGWMTIKGFRKWFSRAPVVEMKRMSALLVEAANEALYEVLTSSDPRLAGAKVQAARTAYEVAGLGSKKTHTVEIADKEVAAMSREEKLKLIAEAQIMTSEDDEE